VRSTARRSPSSRTSSRRGGDRRRRRRRRAGITRRRRRGTATSRPSDRSRATASAPRSSRSTATASCSAAPRSTTHPQRPAREPRAAVGAPRYRPPGTHALAAAVRNRRPRRRASTSRTSTSQPSAPARARRPATLTGCSSARCARLLPRLIAGRRAAICRGTWFSLQANKEGSAHPDATPSLSTSTRRQGAAGPPRAGDLRRYQEEGARRRVQEWWA
jgi:hypothetical protein